MDTKIEFFDFHRVYNNLKKQISESIEEVISSGNFINGQQVKEFEQKFSKRHLDYYTVGVSNGTDAITAAILSADIKEHKTEFIVPSFTFVATAMCPKKLGFEIKFVDTAKDRFHPNIQDVIKLCTKNTAGIIWPHLFGEHNDLSELYDYCKSNEIILIEDCAQSFGSIKQGIPLGCQGDFGTFSFFPAKNLGCFGDGGAVICNNQRYYEKLLMVRNHGYNKKYYSEMLGGNYRLDTIQAAILNVLLEDVDRQISRRKENASFYNSTISNSKIKLPQFKEENSWNQYTLITDDNEKFRKYLLDNGIPSMLYYPYPLHKNPVFKNNTTLTNSEKLCKQVVSIPVYSELSNKELEYISKIIIGY